MPTTCHDLKAHLDSLPNIVEVKPCLLTFRSGLNNRGKHETLDACYYEQLRDGSEPRPAYLIAGLPKCSYRKLGDRWHGDGRIIETNRSVCFQIGGESSPEWYVGCYWLDSKNPVTKAAHPLGPESIIFPWDCGGRLDDNERSIYLRVLVDRDWVGPTPAP